MFRNDCAKIYKIDFFVPKYLYLHDCTEIYYNEPKCMYWNVLYWINVPKCQYRNVCTKMWEPKCQYWKCMYLNINTKMYVPTCIYRNNNWINVPKSQYSNVCIKVYVTKCIILNQCNYMFVPIDIPKYSNVLMYLNEEHTKLLSEYIL